MNRLSLGVPIPIEITWARYRKNLILHGVEEGLKPAETNDLGVMPQKLSPETSIECAANNTKAG